MQPPSRKEECPGKVIGPLMLSDQRHGRNALAREWQAQLEVPLRSLSQNFVHHIFKQGGITMRIATLPLPGALGAFCALIFGGLLLPEGVWAKNYEDKKAEFTATFPIADCNFLTSGSNPYFKLVENRVLHYDNMQCFADGDCDELEELQITVLPEFEMFSFEYNGQMVDVTARVIEEYETADGEFKERSRNFFGECEGTQDVYYFGEDVTVADGSHPGQWRVGEDGALPGIVFPGGAFLLGARYFQEVAPNAEALDRAEHVEMGLEITVGAGTFENCVKINETTPLDKHELSEKWYCPGVGLVQDNDLTLREIVEP
jgi:hypothetical protein